MASDCIEFDGRRSTGGYGQVRLPSGRHVQAHRLAYIKKGGWKLNPEKIEAIRRLSASGVAQFRIAEKFHVSRATVSTILSGKRHRQKEVCHS